MLYAIVDIETSGGFAQNAAITEIAIVITDGERLIEQYETLVNPEQPIPYYITKLTGITDAMVAEAPKFAEIASRVYELLQDKIFVAHNVQFDFSFVNHQLKQENYFLQVKKLCTVKYGKKVITGLHSYSLGNFCRALEIPITNRHRAMGDAMATHFLLKEILKNDRTNILHDFIKSNAVYKNIPLQVDAQDYTKIPTATGVYYFLDKKEKIIYVGKANNLKKRIASHFTGNKISKQRQDFLREIAFIKYEITATELLSLLQESIAIKKYWPKYNIAQKHGEAKFGMYSYEDRSGYIQLCIDKYKKNVPYIVPIKNKVEGLILLRKIVLEHNLCPYKNMVSYIANDTGHANCTTTCVVHSSTKKYNTKVTKAIAKIQKQLESFAFIDSGLQPGEASVIVYRNGMFEAMGYLPIKKNTIYTNKELKQLTTYPANQYINSLLQYYASKFPEKVQIL